MLRLQLGRSFSERRTSVGRGLSAVKVNASMGPLFFRAENQADGGIGRQDHVASMGPLFFRAENDPVERSIMLLPSLQWGRSFSERRTLHAGQLPLVRVAASMGPPLTRGGGGSAEHRDTRLFQWREAYSRNRSDPCRDAPKSCLIVADCQRAV
jgi:hypothetical protein